MKYSCDSPITTYLKWVVHLAVDRRLVMRVLKIGLT